VRSLLYARRAAANVKPRDPAEHRVLVVAMATTPGENDLRGAGLEAAALQEFFPGRVTLLTGAAATRDVRS
jgi:hypothetical protein